MGREFDLVPPRQRLKRNVGILRGMFKRFSFFRQRLDIHKSIRPETENNFSANALNPRFIFCLLVNT